MYRTTVEEIHVGIKNLILSLGRLKPTSLTIYDELHNYESSTFIDNETQKTFTIGVFTNHEDLPTNIIICDSDGTEQCINEHVECEEFLKKTLNF